jgi:hypothetical protein
MTLAILCCRSVLMTPLDRPIDALIDGKA